MRLRELKRAEVQCFGAIRSAAHSWTLYVFPVVGPVRHLGNSIDQAYEFPSSDEAVAFAKFYFPDVAVHVNSLSVEDLGRSAWGQSHV